MRRRDGSGSVGSRQTVRSAGQGCLGAIELGAIAQLSKMHHRYFVLLGLSATAASSAYAIDDGRGKDWRQLVETRPISGKPTWEQIAAVCPQDGVTACTGALGATPMKDWVWATAPQVAELFRIYVPAFPSEPIAGVAGWEYAAAAAQFQATFMPTQSLKGCPTYQPCFDWRIATGMTATIEPFTSPAVPVGAEVSLDAEWGTGSFNLYKPMHPDISRGIWMWRPTGLGTTAVHAYDDVASPAPAGGGIVVANVLANDWVGGVRATIASVNLSMLNSSVAGLSLNGADGSVQVAGGTAAGTYSLEYRICNKASPANCDEATVSVVVPSFPVAAVNDQASASMGAGGIAIANVLANDTVGGKGATPATVRLSQVSTTHAGVTLNLANGTVNVAPGTPNGTHTLTYKICEIANPSNCAQATATVAPYTIYATNDAARASSKTASVVIANVLNNDRFNGALATTANVRISLPSPPPEGITLNTSNGAVSVARKTSSGTYRFDYQICEVLSPANCGQATVTLDLSGRNR